MNDTESVLEKLHDIHVPAAVSIWPLALGWWILIAVLAVVIIAALVWRFVGRRGRPARREALRQLHELRAAYAQHRDGVRASSEISVLIRRTCLARYPRAEVASLTGEAWLIFLDETGRTTEFSKGAGRLLITAPYRKQAEGDIDALVGVTSKWLFTAR